jgi:hypothetical protein
MEWNKQTIKNLLLIVCGGIAFYCLLQNLPSTFRFLHLQSCRLKGRSCL